MEKMTGHPRLYRRGATYYHRAAIPVDIKSTYPKTEETFSLATKDYQEALRLVRIAAVKVDHKFANHRRSLDKPMVKDLTDNQIGRIGEIYFAHLLDEDEGVRLDGFFVEAKGGNEPLQLHPLPRPSFEEYTDDVESDDKATRWFFARGEVDPFYLDEAQEVLTWEGVDLRLDPKSPSQRKLAQALQAATIQAAEAKKARNLGDVVKTPKVANVETGISAPLLSDAVEEWAEEKARTSWVPKTEHEHRVWMGHFGNVAGDKPLSEYAKADARSFKALLLKLPANWNKQDRLKGLPVDRAADLAVELDMPPMSESNVNKLIGFVGSFWTWASNHYDDAPPNIFKGLKVATQKNAREERDPFTTQELQAIFAAPLYTGCKSAHHWHTPGDEVPRDAGGFWVPLISLLTGARLGEIIQLYADDVREEGGIAFFDINDEGDDKRLKNANSKRFIPIHPTLIDIGLMDHVALRRSQRQERLFPDLNMGNDGYYSSPFSKRFNRFLTSVGVKQEKNSFHSFRHCFEDACRASGISKEIMDALQGHSGEGMSQRYGRGYMLRTLDEAMKGLRYADLDLKHLLP